MNKGLLDLCSSLGLPESSLPDSSSNQTDFYVYYLLVFESSESLPDSSESFLLVGLLVSFLVLDFWLLSSFLDVAFDVFDTSDLDFDVLEDFDLSSSDPDFSDLSSPSVSLFSVFDLSPSVSLYPSFDSPSLPSSFLPSSFLVSSLFSYFFNSFLSSFNHFSTSLT